MFRNGKVPFVLILITLGFLFEFIINLPLMVICELDTRLRKKF
jgi:hypothetical protein